MNDFKTLEEVLKEGNSTTNQQIKSDFISKHVYCNVNSLVEPLLNNLDTGFDYEDIENFFSYPEHNGVYISFQGGTQEDFEEAIEDAKNELSELEEELEKYDTDSDTEEVNNLKEKIAEFEDEIDEFERLETEPQEIFEWYAVSSFLFEKLQNMGHPVLDTGRTLLWGRCTTGQAVLLDYAITVICANMGILEGQESDWSKY